MGMKLVTGLSLIHAFRAVEINGNLTDSRASRRAWRVSLRRRRVAPRYGPHCAAGAVALATSNLLPPSDPRWKGAWPPASFEGSPWNRSRPHRYKIVNVWTRSWCWLQAESCLSAGRDELRGQKRSGESLLGVKPREAGNQSEDPSGGLNPGRRRCCPCDGVAQESGDSGVGQGDDRYC